MKLLTLNMWLINSLSFKKSPPPFKKERTEGFLKHLANGFDEFENCISEEEILIQSSNDSESCDDHAISTDIESSFVLVERKIPKEKQQKSDKTKAHKMFDVVVLQEVFRYGNTFFELFENTFHEMIVKKGTNELNYHVALSDPPYPLCQDSGLLILSKYPIVCSKNYVFQNTSWNDYVTGKGVLYAKIHSPHEGVIHLFTLHMDAHDENIRRSQVDELIAFIRDCTYISYAKRKHTSSHQQNLTKHNIVLAGDFNIDSLVDLEIYEYLMNELNSKICKNYIQDCEFKDIFGSDLTKHPKTHRNMCLDHIIYTVPTSSNDLIFNPFASRGRKKSSREPNTVESTQTYHIVDWNCDIGNDEKYPISDHFGIATDLKL
ncbi:hypothetical protein C9374_005713 [Naegleria lovaniensis]|uniref:Endonuclease/exonuclease/phosphatase domain-containing protein n=1 Tax=Naegleria lovaniensis TaxID=51637 RepID=A0AA88KMW8_NAELO|nr:uncharacterized protein C9374_005713 [Naegleria lovaniensis]KAG2381921.1 hypothetical protein C9374_005713 [Naegleria lovaniensis]